MTAVAVLGAELGRTDEAGAADLVAGLEVEDVALVGIASTIGSGSAAEDADRELAPLDEPLEQHAVVVAEADDQGGGHLVRRAANLTPSAEPWPAGLTISGMPSRSSISPSASAAPSSRKAVALKANQSGVGIPSGAHLVLGQDLVHAANAGGDAGAGVGEAEDLEQLLGRAVLAIGAVQGDEGDVGPLGGQPLHQIARRRRTTRTSWPSRSTASSTRAPERSETPRSSERPPFRTATFTAALPQPCGGTERPTHRSRTPPGTPSAPGRAAEEAAGERLLAGQRLVQLDLLPDDLADPGDPLADLAPRSSRRS